MKSLDLIVLGYDDNPNRMFRTYLAYLRAGGLRPKGIVLMRFARATPRFTATCAVVGERLARKLLLWRRRRFGGPADRLLARQLLEGAAIQPDFFGPLAPAAFADSYQEVWLEGLDDPSLRASSRDDRAAPSCTLVEAARRGACWRFQVRFLHCHPGVVPAVKRADGFFWSLLERGRPGASCFYMNEEIDTEDIIATRDFERPVFRIDLARWGSTPCGSSKWPADRSQHRGATECACWNAIRTSSTAGCCAPCWSSSPATGSCWITASRRVAGDAASSASTTG